MPGSAGAELVPTDIVVEIPGRLVDGHVEVLLGRPGRALYDHAIVELPASENVAVWPDWPTWPLVDVTVSDVAA